MTNLETLHITDALRQTGSGLLKAATEDHTYPSIRHLILPPSVVVLVASCPGLSSFTFIGETIRDYWGKRGSDQVLLEALVKCPKIDTLVNLSPVQSYWKRAQSYYPISSISSMIPVFIGLPHLVPNLKRISFDRFCRSPEDPSFVVPDPVSHIPSSHLAIRDLNSFTHRHLFAIYVL